MVEFVKQGYPEKDNTELQWIVDSAWIIADAMLAAREQGESE
jgi:hypothetical protein